MAEDYTGRVAHTLHEQVGNVEEEWGLFKLAFVGVAEQLCGRTTSKHRDRERKVTCGGRRK